MSNYINKYSNQSAYDADTTKQYPNTSLVGTEIVFKMEGPFDGIIATFNVTSTSEATKLLDRTDNVSKVWIDGVEQTEVIGSYQFLTTGEHEVKYALIDPTTTGYQAFRSCKSLTSITIPDTVINIGSKAFNGCSGLTNITIPDSVTSIDSSAFKTCTGLTNITIPSSVTSIGDEVFYQCTGLTSIVVDSANTVYDSRNNCNAIINTSTNELVIGCKDTVIPNTVTSIGESAFENCTSLTSITIPNNVTSIGNKAFINCRGLTSIDIPNSVTSIGNYAFLGCSGLTSVTIGRGVTSIGNYAFSDCTGLTSITIPNSVTSIGESAFNRCSNLTSFTIQATTPPTLSVKVFDYTNNCPIYVPAESVEAYKTTGNWVTYADRIVEYTFDGIIATFNVTSTSEATKLLDTNDYITYQIIDGVQQSSVQMDYTFDTLGEHIVKYKLSGDRTSGNQFYGCQNMISAILPDSLTYLTDAFSNCQYLQNVIFGKDVTYMDGTLNNCSRLTSVTINATTPPTLGNNTFYNTNNCPIYVPAESVEAYKAASGWSRYASRIQAIPSE